MKRLFTLLAVLLLTASYAGAQIVTERCWHLDKVQFLQHKQDFWRSHKLFSTSARQFSSVSGGFYNLTELQYGFGLKEIDVPFSNHYMGISTINGYMFAANWDLVWESGIISTTTVTLFRSLEMSGIFWETRE